MKQPRRFYTRLRQLFEERKQITTFGPYSPGQAVMMKRIGMEGIYLGGWATSAKGSLAEDPGPDLASYPLGQVPDEAAGLVRALLTADKNQHFTRARMTEEQRQSTPAVDFRPFIIADADTGHGGDAHVRNLIRRFVEVGVPGYHIEDQKPGAKKCGHQGGKVLVSVDEQIKRLNAARLQLDIMRVPGIIVARTDAEAATFIENRSDERDQPFILGATNLDLPSYKAGYLAILRKLYELGVDEVRGHMLFALSEVEYAAAFDWLERVGLLSMITERAPALRNMSSTELDAALDKIDTRYVETWQAEAGMKTYGRAVAELLEFRTAEGYPFDMTVEEWLAFASRASHYEARERARSMGIHVTWDCELPKTPEGFYHIQAGIGYAIAKSLAVAPFADVLWMETKTADIEDAEKFAQAIHAEFPDKMLAYNLSPSFSWDTTGMNDEQMKRFPEELGKLGYVFNFITYGGHQIDGLAAEEFATALKQDGMLALARLQRKFRLLESPVSHAANAGRRSAPRCRSYGLVGSHGRHESNGQGFHAIPAPGADRSPDQAPRRLARRLEQAQQLRREDSRPPAPAHRRFGASRAQRRERTQWREASQCCLRLHPRSSRTPHPLCSRLEYPRAGPQEAAHDGGAALPDPSLQREFGALCHAHRGQPVPDAEDEERRHLLRGPYRDRADHRRASQ